MNFLACDPGSNPGLTIISDSGEILFSECFKTPADLPLSARLSIIWARISYLLHNFEIQCFIIEDVAAISGSPKQFNNHNFIKDWIYGEALRLTWERNIQALIVTPGQAKKEVTGKYNAPKKAVLEAIQKSMPEVCNENQADSIALARFGLKAYKQQQEEENNNGKSNNKAPKRKTQ